MARQSCIAGACGWLVSAVFWSWIAKSSYFPDRFRNEKWNARGHSVCAHRQHFQSRRTCCAYAISSVARSSLTQLDMILKEGAAQPGLNPQRYHLARTKVTGGGGFVWDYQPWTFVLVMRNHRMFKSDCAAFSCSILCLTYSAFTFTYLFLFRPLLRLLLPPRSVSFKKSSLLFSFVCPSVCFARMRPK